MGKSSLPIASANTRFAPTELVTIHKFMQDHEISGGVDLEENIDSYILDENKRYQIERLLGTGGMGAIFISRDHNSRRKVAMKVVLDSHKQKDEKIIRFIEEAQVTGQLEHPNIVPVHELGADVNGNVYYTMKLVRGQTLDEVLNGIRNGDEGMIKRFPLTALLTVFQKICDAVRFAHSRGVVHRDLKPENIMVGDFGEVHVMDWGVAKIVPENSSQADDTRSKLRDNDWMRHSVESLRDDVMDAFHTMDGAIIGTPAYMAPEQACGLVDIVDQRSDIYSLGCILHCILVLRPPFRAEDSVREVLMNVVNSPLVPPDQLLDENGSALQLPHCPSGRVPSGLSAVCACALSKHPDDRYQGVGELQHELDLWLGGFATTAEEASSWRQFTLFARRHKLETGVVVTLLLTLVLVASNFLARLNHETTLAEKNSMTARDAARQFKDAQRKTTEARQAAVRLIIEKAQQALSNNEWEKAASLAEQATKTDENNPLGHLLTGRIALANHNFSGSAQALNNALEHENKMDESSLKQARYLRLYAMSCQRAAGELGLINRETLEKVTRKLKRREEDALVTRMHKVFDALANTTPGRLVNLAEVLRESNPGIEDLEIDIEELEDGSFAVNLSGNNELTNISALANLNLGRLFLNDTNIRDISPIATMNELTGLGLAGTPVADISVLRRLPLTALSIANTEVADLSPIRNMPLASLSISHTNVTNLAPLARLRLSRLQMAGLAVADISALSGMPLTQLNLDNCWQLRDFTPLAGLAALQELLLPPTFGDLSFLKNHSRLSHISTGAESQQTAAEFWEQHETGLFAALAGLHELNPEFAVRELPDVVDGRIASWDLSHAAISDVTPLAGLPVEALDLSFTQIRSIQALTDSPLKSLKLHRCAQLESLYALAKLKDIEELTLPAHIPEQSVLENLENIEVPDYGWYDVDGTNSADTIAYQHQALKAWNPEYTGDGEFVVNDEGQIHKVSLPESGISSLEPLRGQPLVYLDCAFNDIGDLSPLRGMPLKELDFTGNIVSELDAIENLPLMRLRCSGNRIQSVDTLRSMTFASLDISANPITSLGHLVENPPVGPAFYFFTRTLPTDELERAMTAWADEPTHQLHFGGADILMALHLRESERLSRYTHVSGDRRYLFVPRPCTWLEARDTAAELGGDLVTIDDEEENATLAELLGRHPRAWIGLEIDGCKLRWLETPTQRPRLDERGADDQLVAIGHGALSNDGTWEVKRPESRWRLPFLVEWAIEPIALPEPLMDDVPNEYIP